MIYCQKTKGKDPLQQTKVVKTVSMTGSRQNQDIPEGVPPAGYFWHTTCAEETCKQKWDVDCPPQAVCQQCGLVEANSPICPKASLLDPVASPPPLQQTTSELSW